MYTFFLKENKAEITIVITRILLAVAGIVVLLFSITTYFFISLITAVFLLLLSYFVKMISLKLKISSVVILVIATAVVFIVTCSDIITVVLLSYAVLLNYLQKTPEVIISNEAVVLKKVFKDEIFSWAQFNNIILKDGLLTLDFTDNKLLHLYVDDLKTIVDAPTFNLFCKMQLIKATTFVAP